MSAPQLRDYQIDVVRRIESETAAGRRRLCLVAPTGSGKTVIAAALIAKAADRSEHVLFMAHRRELIEQSSRKLHDTGVDHGIIQAGYPPRLGERVQIASIQTLHRITTSEPAPRGIDRDRLLDKSQTTPAENLTVRLGGRWHGRYGEGRCPVHEDRHPSLSIRDGERSILVKCHAGCPPEAVIAALRRSGLWPDVLRQQWSRVQAKRPLGGSRQYLLWIWRQSRPIGGTPAQRYLRSRGIEGELPPSLRYHPSLNHSPTGLLLPCMVAAVQAPDRSIAGLHRTFLRADGTGKALVPKPRMMLGQVAGGAVRLSAATAELAIGEGIETCLAFQWHQGIGTWAALSASGLRSVALPARPLAATVYLLVDRDSAGEEGTQIAAARFSRQGRRVKLARPVAGNDFNDVLLLAPDAR